MLIKAKTLEGFKLDSLDGEIGKVKEFYFDDRYWTIRYLVADTGTWLTGRQVLISPYALGDVNREGQDIAIDLTKSKSKTVPRWTVTSPCPTNSSRLTTGIMDGQRIGMVRTRGAIIPPLSVTAKNGKLPPGLRKRGNCIYAALTV